VGNAANLAVCGNISPAANIALRERVIEFSAVVRTHAKILKRILIMGGRKCVYIAHEILGCTSQQVGTGVEERKI